MKKLTTLVLAFAALAPAANAKEHCSTQACHASFIVSPNYTVHWTSPYIFKKSDVWGLAVYVEGHPLGFIDGGCSGWVYGRGLIFRINTCGSTIRLEAKSLRGGAVRAFFSYVIAKR